MLDRTKAMKHEDDRRILFDWANGNFKSIKTVYIKEPINIGDHHHKNKDEYFMLVHGTFLEMQVGEVTLFNLKAPYIITIFKNTYHRFVCEPGSILVCGATELFDENDEIKK